MDLYRKCCLRPSNRPRKLSRYLDLGQYFLIKIEKEVIVVLILIYIVNTAFQITHPFFQASHFDLQFGNVLIECANYTIIYNQFFKSSMWKKYQFSTNPSFLRKVLTTRLRHVSAYYQVIINADKQFSFLKFYNDI